MKFRSHDPYAFWLLLYPVAIALGIIFSLLLVTRRIRVRHRSRMPWPLQRIVIVSNHPSLWEPIWLPFLFFPRFLWRPHQRIPFCTPDETNYVKPWIMYPLRPRFIGIPRGDRSGMSRAYAQMLHVIKNGHNLILFPEGGRTNKGKEFQHSRNGKRIRHLKQGVAELVRTSGATLVPVWVDGTDRIMPSGSAIPRLWIPMTMTIGKPLHFSPEQLSDRDSMLNALSHALLELADE